MPLPDDTVSRFVAMGGVVMIPLLAVGGALWYLLVLRGLSLRRGVSGTASAALYKASTGTQPTGGVIGGAISEILAHRSSRGIEAAELERILQLRRQRIDRYSRVILAFVAAAPLLGLLGTVSGMIETFHALTEMALVSETGGISGGISEALVTTQMGLAIAIPGMVVARVLEGRARRLRRDLDELATVSQAALARAGEGAP